MKIKYNSIKFIANQVASQENIILEWLEKIVSLHIHLPYIFFKRDY